VLADSDAQDRVTQSLSQMFPSAKTIDRRIETSHGYRAVHVIVSVDGHLVEIQVRTSLQHLWAEFSEKLSDILDPSIKYGGGEERVRILLQKASEFASMGDAASALLAKMERVLMAAESSASSPDALALISDRKKELDRRRREGSDLDSRMSALLINLVIALEDGEA
jgi:ppGpp synthetase/RelA/SpoT-type nucleotidyltranferase